MSTGAEVGVVAADLMVVVVVSPGRDGERHDLEYLVNYSDWPVKDWLTKTTVWAATNSRTLTLRGATDDDLRSRRQFRPKSGRVQNDEGMGSRLRDDGY